MTLFKWPLILYQLRWKLALSYVFVTLSAVFIADVIEVTRDYYSFRSGLNPIVIQEKAKLQIPLIAQSIKENQLNTLASTLWIEKLELELNSRKYSPSYYNFNFEDLSQEAFLISLVSNQGTVISALPEGKVIRGVSIKQVFLPKEIEIMNLFLEGKIEEDFFSKQKFQNKIFTAIPIFNEANQIQSALVVSIDTSFRLNDWFRKILSVWHYDLSTGSLYIIFFGLVFGLMFSWKLTKRLSQINKAAVAWGQGDFSVVTDSQSKDELGQLAYRLNQMAKELKQLVSLQQELAASEERNRLARDLHDTVKQQVFALTMQIAAARALAIQSESRVETNLIEAEKLAKQAQQELVTIIQELKPIHEKKEKFAESVQNYLSDWSRQNNIVTEFSNNKNIFLHSAIAHTFLRIIQEALANVARHSQALNVIIKLEQKLENEIILFINDDGIGFNKETVLSNGMGLRNMKERAESLENGWFIINTQLNKGTSIQIGCHVTERKI